MNTNSGYGLIKTAEKFITAKNWDNDRRNMQIVRFNKLDRLCNRSRQLVFMVYKNDSESKLKEEEQFMCSKVLQDSLSLTLTEYPEFAGRMIIQNVSK